MEIRDNTLPVLGPKGGEEEVDHLPGDLLHGLRIQSCGIDKHGQWISPKRILCKNIDLVEFKFQNQSLFNRKDAEDAKKTCLLGIKFKKVQSKRNKGILEK